MKVCRSLAEKLEAFAEAGETTVDEVWRQILYEIPDEALEQLHGMADPVELDLSEETQEITESMASDFGMTSMGLSVLMDKIIERAMKARKKLEDYERQSQL